EELNKVILSRLKKKLPSIEETMRRLDKPLPNSLSNKEEMKERIQTYIEQMDVYSKLAKQYDLSEETKQLMQRLKVQVLLNTHDLSSHNPDEICRIGNSEFVNLLRDNKVLDLYANAVLSSEKKCTDLFRHAYDKLGEEVTKKALCIAEKSSVLAAQDYIVLVQNYSPEKAEPYFTRIQSGEAYEGIKTDFSKECKKLLQSLKDSAWGINDLYLNEFINEKSDLLENYSDLLAYSNYEKLYQEIQTVYDVMNSPEMKAVKQEVERFERNAQNLFSIGNQKKANLIKQAVFNVPLLERMHVFSNTENPLIQKVREALAFNRGIISRTPVHHGEINESKAATSFHNVKSKLVTVKQGSGNNPEDPNTVKKNI
ncbi:hypothetical protein, partial [Legionella norrlandica]|uniref:hypothetical protein n=1 Tax=Legionella norrlandica TaxID=1498499 RepID=UPI000565E798